jgi:hypothetical protein
MFSYGEDNKVRFDKAQGIMGIFAPNASQVNLLCSMHYLFVYTIRTQEPTPLRTF